MDYMAYYRPAQEQTPDTQTPNPQHPHDQPFPNQTQNNPNNATTPSRFLPDDASSTETLEQVPLSLRSITN